MLGMPGLGCGWQSKAAWRVKRWSISGRNKGWAQNQTRDSCVSWCTQALGVVRAMQAKGTCQHQSPAVGNKRRVCYRLYSTGLLQRCINEIAELTWHPAPA